MKRQMLAVGLGVLCLGATLATATPASAGTSIGWTKTTDAAPGGEGKFTNNGDIITVCDVESDGWAATVWIDQVYSDGTTGSWGYVRDGGNDGRCQTKSFSGIPEGAKVRFEICLWKDDKGAKYCRNSATGAA